MIDRTIYPISNPLILVEVTPVIGASPKTAITASTSHPISAPMAKARLMQLCRQEMFHSGWMQHTGQRQKKSARPTNENTKSGSLGGMFLRVDRETTNVSEMNASSSTSDETENIISGMIQLQSKSSKHCNSKPEYDSNSIPIIYLKSDDPLCESGVPCLLRGYMFDYSEEPITSEMIFHQRCFTRCSVVIGTSVQILNPVDVETINRGDIRNNLAPLLSRQVDRCGESINSNSTEMQSQTQPSEFPSPNIYSKLSCYDQEAVRGLALRMSIMLMNTAWVGTTPNALNYWRSKFPKTIDRQTLREFFALQQRNNKKQEVDIPEKRSLSPNATGSDSIPHLLREGALLLYN